MKPATPRRVQVPASISPAGGRRQFSEEVKERIVQETCRPGASVSAIARRYGIDLRLLFRWRHALGVEPPPPPTAFVTVRISDEAAPEANLCEGARP
jgi:transposase